MVFRCQRMNQQSAVHALLGVSLCFLSAQYWDTWIHGVLMTVVGLYFVICTYLLETKLRTSFHSAVIEHTGSGKTMVRLASSLRDKESNGLWLMYMPLLVRLSSEADRDLLLSWNIPGILLTLLHPLLTGNRRLIGFTLLFSFVVGLCYGVEAWNQHLPRNSFIGSSFLASASSTWAFYSSWMGILFLLPRSFTVGEAGFLVQCALLAVVKLFTNSHVETDLPEEILLTMKASVLATAWLIISASLFRRCRVHAIPCYLNIVGTVLVSIWIVSKRIGQNLLVFGWEYFVKGGKSRWCLLLFWSLCLCASVIFVGAAQSAAALSTRHRKFFHFSSGLVCVSGLQLDPELTVLASCILMAGLVIIEVSNAHVSPPLWEKVLAPTFNVFTFYGLPF